VYKISSKAISDHYKNNEVLFHVNAEKESDAIFLEIESIVLDLFPKDRL